MTVCILVSTPLDEIGKRYMHINNNFMYTSTVSVV